VKENMLNFNYKEVNSVGKVLSEVERAYIAGLIDADGAIMALIEHHKEKRFRFRVRIELKVTQKQTNILDWLQKVTGLGRVRKNRTTFDWLTRNQDEIYDFLKQLLPYLKIKSEQAKFALMIISRKVHSEENLLEIARLADTLSTFNPRSRNRRKNFATMIEESISPND